MSPIKFNALELDHIVEFSKDHTLFVAARENGSGHLRLFLISAGGNVYTRNGRADSWGELGGADKTSIVARITAARNNHVPTYHVNGSSR
jgi:hypothetical protein